MQLVTKLSMLDRGRCQVDWRLRGSIAVFPIDVDFASEFGLDLITGRVNAHSERWDLGRYVHKIQDLVTFNGSDVTYCQAGSGLLQSFARALLWGCVMLRRHVAGM